MQVGQFIFLDKYLYVKNRLINETRVVALVQAGTQANQFASSIACAGNKTNFTKNRTGKSFFSQDSKETSYLIFVSAIRKGISGKHPIRENKTYVCFH